MNYASSSLFVILSSLLDEHGGIKNTKCAEESDEERINEYSREKIIPSTKKYKSQPVHSLGISAAIKRIFKSVRQKLQHQQLLQHLKRR